MMFIPFIPFTLFKTLGFNPKYIPPIPLSFFFHYILNTNEWIEWFFAGFYSKFIYRYSHAKNVMKLNLKYPKYLLLPLLAYVIYWSSSQVCYTIFCIAAIFYVFLSVISRVVKFKLYFEYFWGVFKVSSIPFNIVSRG